MNRYPCAFRLICLGILVLNSGRAASQPAAALRQPGADAGLEAAVQQALYGVETAPGGFVATNPA